MNMLMSFSPSQCSVHFRRGHRAVGPVLSQMDLGVVMNAKTLDVIMF